MDLLNPISKCGKDSESSKYYSTPYVTLKRGKLFKISKVVPVLTSHRNQLIDLDSKSIDWFLYEDSSGTLSYDLANEDCLQ